MSRLSLRWLLLGSVLVTMTVALLASAVLIDRVERSNRIADIDDELVRAANTQVGRRPPGAPVEFVVDDADGIEAPVGLLLDADGRVLNDQGRGSPFDESVLEELAGTTGNTTIERPRYRVQTAVAPDGATIVTALSLEAFDDAVRRFRVAVALGEGMALLLVAGVLYVVTGRLVRPVTDMAAVASKIADGHLDTSVGEPGGSRETAELTADMDRMLTRLRAALEDAHTSRQTTERFLADMAHEIRTPLTALKGYSDLYAQGMLEKSTDVDRAMDRIGSESERLAQLADGMLQLASASLSTDTKAAVDLGSVAADVVADLRAAYPGQRIELEVASSSGLTVGGVRPRLHQAILNLGSNACHHNPEPHPIVVAVGLVGDLVEVTVSDHGSGVAPGDAERIFQPFFRSDEARSRNGQTGAGLGLALTMQIAEQHGGTVAVTDRVADPAATDAPTTGAVFTLQLPKISH